MNSKLIYKRTQASENGMVVHTYVALNYLLIVKLLSVFKSLYAVLKSFFNFHQSFYNFLKPLNNQTYKRITSNAMTTPYQHQPIDKKVQKNLFFKK